MSTSLLVTADDGIPIATHVDPGPPGAPTVVLAHSLGCDYTMWQPQVQALARHFRVVRFDHRGHGQSGAPANDYSIERLGLDALAVLQATSPGQPAHFVGLSMGAMVGLWLAIHHPERLERLVLANTAAHIPLRAMFEQRMQTARTEGMGAIAAPTIDRWLSEAFRQQHPAQRDALVSAMQQMSPHGYAGCCAVLRDADLRPDLPRVSPPTLVIGGSVDVSTTPEAMHALAASLTDARVLILDGASHLSNLESPAAFNDALIHHFQTKETA